MPETQRMTVSGWERRELGIALQKSLITGGKELQLLVGALDAHTS
ncbi:hypothetical protein [Scytonema sp. PCC 10023]